VRPFRFGVNLWGAGSRAEWQDKARKVEDLGFATLTVPDHLTELIAPFPAIVSAAAVTSRIELGTNVLNNDLRHPVLVAREAATADLLSDGRLLLGLGAGSIRAEYREAGVDFDRGGVRVDRLAEAIIVIKGLLRGDAVSFAGHHYRIDGHRIGPLPVRRPHPPILIGGNGPRLLALAAREADIVGLSGITFRNGGLERDLSAWGAAAVDERIRLIREAAGDRYPGLEICALVQRVITTDDRLGAAEELARHWPALSVDVILETPYLLIGTLDEMEAALHARRARWGISYHVVQEPYLDALAPVIACVAGK
jgi:probable F420-dependent oxidoreductase